MKMAILHAIDDLRLDDVPRPLIGDNDILIKVNSAGICGTDLHFRHMGPRFEGKAMPLGHEYAGEIVEAGPGVSTYRIGERVCYNSNNSPADMGRGGEFGGFAEYVALRDVDQHPQSLCRIPDHVSDDHAALVEPISVGTHAVNRAQLQSQETVTVFGAGPIGLGIIATLRARGFTDVVVFEPSPYRRQCALRNGASSAWDPREVKAREVLGELRGHGAIWGIPHPRTDVYFEASGAAGLIPEIAGFCNKGARIISVAIHREPLVLDGTRLMSKEISLIGAQGYPSEYPEVLAGIAAGDITPEDMISHRFPFEQFLDAFEVADDPAQTAKVILQFKR